MKTEMTVEEIELEAKKIHSEFPTNWTYHAPEHFERIYYFLRITLSLLSLKEKNTTIELAFQHQKFSGLVINNAFVETGEVVEYIKKQEKKIEELELLCNIYKDERDELRSLHDAGIKEAYRICGIEDDGEYRWKWVLLELSSQVRRIKSLEEGIEKHRSNQGKIDPFSLQDAELYKLIKGGGK